MEDRNPKSDVNHIKKYERTPVLSNVKTKSYGRDGHLANDDNAELKVLSVGNVKSLDTAQNTAD